MTQNEAKWKGEMRVIEYSPGGPENLILGRAPIPKIKSDEILLKVYATAINRADTLQRQGKYPPPPGESEIIGLEAAGIVEKVGDNVKKWKIGDKVMCLLSGGGYAEFVAAHEDLTMPIPTNFTFVEASAIPEAWLTAFQLLYLVGELKKGDTVLVHAGASGVGIAAIQIAKYFGAKVVASASTSEKLDFCRGMGADFAFNYKSEEFKENILDATRGKGVDLILDCVGESMWEKNYNVIGMDGRWVLYGLLGGPNLNGPILAKLLAKRLRIQASTLRSRTLAYKADLVKQFSDLVLPKISDGKLKIVIDSAFSLGKIADAHKLMESNKNIGKIVVHVRNGETDSDMHMD